LTNFGFDVLCWLGAPTIWFVGVADHTQESESVVIVPGDAMAVAQAQYLVDELCEILYGGKGRKYGLSLIR